MARFLILIGRKCQWKRFSATNKIDDATGTCKNDMQKTHNFDIGYLVKSPCRSCEKAGDLPACMDHCKTLQEVQKLLSQGKSISSLSSPDDESALCIGRDSGNF